MNIVEILINLFSFENNNEALIFYSILFLALLLGVFFTYIFIARPSLKKKRKKISDLLSDLEMANSKIKLTEEKYSVQLSKTKRLEEEVTKMQVLIDELQVKNTNFQNEIGQLQFEKETLQFKSENSEKEILELKNLYNISLQENSSSADRFSILIDEKNQALKKADDYAKRIEVLENELKNYNASTEIADSNKNTAIEKLEQEKNILKEENSRLNRLLNEKEQQQLETLKQLSILKQRTSAEESEDSKDLIVDEKVNNELADNEVSTVETQSENKELEEENVNDFIATESLETDLLETVSQSNVEIEDPEHKEYIKIGDNANLNNLADEIKNFVGIANTDHQDNLKLINGIDTELEEKLNTIGISSYEQISRLNDDSINQKLCQVLQIKEKSIESDQWEAQARQLLIKQKINSLTKDMNLSKLFKK